MKTINYGNFQERKYRSRMMAKLSLFKPFKTMWNYAKPINRPHYKKSDREKQYGQTVDKWKEEGQYSPGMQREVVSDTTRTAADAYHQTVGDVRGQTYASGLQNSAVTPQITASMGNTRTKTAADTARAISLMNESSKIDAENLSYGIGKRDSDIRYGNKMAQYKDRKDRRADADEYFDQADQNVNELIKLITSKSDAGAGGNNDMDKLKEFLFLLSQGGGA